MLFVLLEEKLVDPSSVFIYHTKWVLNSKTASTPHFLWEPSAQEMPKLCACGSGDGVNQSHARWETQILKDFIPPGSSK